MMFSKQADRPWNEFKECTACDAKSGSPTMCPSCYHNSQAINKLQRNITTLRQKLSIINTILNMK